MASGQDDQVLRSVTLGGHQRLVARLPVDLAVLDVDPQGRLLLERRLRRGSVVALLPGESRERDLSLLDTSSVGDISADGRLLVLGEEGSSPGTDVAYLRKTDGSPAVRLGEDSGHSLSPDGRFVLAFPQVQAVRDHLILVPTGAGERRELRHPSIREFAVGGAWFPDGRRIACVGAEAGKEGMRLFVLGHRDGCAAPALVSRRRGGLAWLARRLARWPLGGGHGRGRWAHAVCRRRGPGPPARRQRPERPASCAGAPTGGGSTCAEITCGSEARRRRGSTGSRWPPASGSRGRSLTPADPAGVYYIGPGSRHARREELRVLDSTPRSRPSTWPRA